MNDNSPLIEGSGTVIEPVRMCPIDFSLASRSPVSLPHITLAMTASNIVSSMMEAVLLKQS